MCVLPTTGGGSLCMYVCMYAFSMTFHEFVSKIRTTNLDTNEDINTLDKIQRRAAKMIPGLRHLSYEE